MSIGDKVYYFVDTPGFDDGDTAWDAFVKIMDMIKTIRANAIFAGVWYVIANSRSQDANFETKFLNWLTAFRSDDFVPYLTFITTYWESTHSMKLKD